MKMYAVAVAAILVAGSAHADDAFSLVGTWTGPRERIAKVDGWRTGDATMVITEQKGRTFTGYLGRANPSGNVKENLWGAFTPNGRLMMASDEEGFYAFDLVDNDTLDYCYSEAGSSPRTVCATLKRQK